MKLIVSDVDGTLIGADRKIPQAADQLGALIERHDLPFTIASGRIPGRIAELVSRLHIRLPYIGCNGACARLGDEYLWNDWIPSECIRKAIELADRFHMSSVYTNGTWELAYRRTPWIAELMDVHGRYDGVRAPDNEEWEKMQIQKVLIADAAEPESVERVLEALAPYEEMLNIVRYEDGTLDITTKGSSKEAAVKRLAGIMGIEAEEIMAIGDHQNDIGMITYAGLGVAVANASGELKEAADYICEKPLADGVLEAVGKFCIEEKR